MDGKLHFLKEQISAKVFVNKNAGAKIARETGELENWIFDFRAVVLNSQWLDTYAEVFWERYASAYPFQVCGLETAGIPLVAAIVMKGVSRGTPVEGLYIRKSRKKNGLTKYIEGTPTKEPVIVVDDLMNTGTSVLRQLSVLRDAGLSVKTVFEVMLLRKKDSYTFGGDVVIESLFTCDDFGLDPMTEPPPLVALPFKIQWRFQSKNPDYHHAVEKSAPVVDDTHLYVGSDNGTFWALNQDDGTVLWQKKIGLFQFGKGIFSSPALHQGTVYFGGYDGNIYALNTGTGDARWVNRDADWIGSSPSLAPDLGLLFIGLEMGLWKKKGGIVALDMYTGTRVWSYTMPEYTHCSPLYLKDIGRVVIGSNDNKIYCLDAKKGTLEWVFETGDAPKSCFAYDSARSLVIGGSLDGSYYALDTKTGACRWKFKTSDGIFSTPLIVGDAVYCTSLDKHVYALSLDDGRELWRFATYGRIFATPVYAEGSLWVGSNDGRLYELDSKTGRAHGTLQFSERITNAIAYNPKTKRFFIPTFANEIYALTRT